MTDISPKQLSQNKQEPTPFWAPEKARVNIQYFERFYPVLFSDKFLSWFKVKKTALNLIFKVLKLLKCVKIIMMSFLENILSQSHNLSQVFVSVRKCHKIWLRILSTAMKVFYT